MSSSLGIPDHDLFHEDEDDEDEGSGLRLPAASAGGNVHHLSEYSLRYSADQPPGIVHKIRVVPQGYEDHLLLEQPSHRVQTYRILLILILCLLLASGLTIFASSLYLLFESDRSQMHQLVLLSLQEISTEDVLSTSISKLLDKTSPMIFYLLIGLLSISFFMCLFSAVGLWAAVKENRPFLIMLCLVLGILLCSQLANGFLAIALHLRATEDLRHILMARLQKTYNLPGSEFFSAAVDFVQARYECCGVTADQDYDLSLWKTNQLGGARLIYPLTCCNLLNFQDPVSFLNPVPRNLDECMAESSRSRHRKACINPITEWARDEFLIIISASFGSALVGVSTIVLTLYLIKHLRRRETFG